MKDKELDDIIMYENIDPDVRLNIFLDETNRRFKIEFVKKIALYSLTLLGLGVACYYANKGKEKDTKQTIERNSDYNHQDSEYKK